MINKDKIKNSLTPEQIFTLLIALEADPQMKIECIVSRTICHNAPGEGSYKLYYYFNTHLFKCYTDCIENSFDIFELIIKVKKQKGEEWTLYNAITYVINFFSLDFGDYFSGERKELRDWQFFQKWEKNTLYNESKKTIELQTFSDKFLNNFPRPIIVPWSQEGIKKEICDARKICYDPSTHGVIIPHYNINNKLVGVRERTLVKENEVYGKYRPAIFNGKMYNHPLGYNLYNLNFSKGNIQNIKKAIVFESEKSCLKMASYFGIENDNSVACCGSNLISYQAELLLSLGVQEIVIALDRQYQEIGDDEWKNWTKKLYNLHYKYGKYVQISYMFDKEYLLGYKDSPIDAGIDVFLELFKKRIIL